MNGERMDAALELAAQRGIDHAVALEPALSAKRLRHDINPEMGLSARPVTCVPHVLVGFVHHLDALWRERRTQFFRDEIPRCHECAHSARDDGRSTVGAGEKRANVLVKT